MNGRSLSVTTIPNGDVVVNSARLLSRGEVSTLMGAYEECHAVEDYVVDGMRVWPIVRTLCSWALSKSFAIVKPTRVGEEHCQAGRLRAMVGAARSRSRQVLKKALARTTRPVPALPETRGSVVMMSDDTWREQLGHVSFHKLADPLRRELEARGLELALWQPRCGIPAHLDLQTRPWCLW